MSCLILDCARADVSLGNLTSGPSQRFQQCQIKCPLIRALETQRHRHVHHDLYLYGNNLELLLFIKIMQVQMLLFLIF